MTNVDSKHCIQFTICVLEPASKCQVASVTPPGPYTGERASTIPKCPYTIAEARGAAALSKWKGLLGSSEGKVWPRVFHTRNRNV